MANPAVDANTGEIVASDLTSRRTHDCTRVPALLEQINGRVTSVSADGAYDTEGVYEAAQVQGEGRMVSRTLAGQRVEVQLACSILNTMASLGMPDSSRVG